MRRQRAIGVIGVVEIDGHRLGRETAETGDIDIAPGAIDAFGAEFIREEGRHVGDVPGVAGVERQADILALQAEQRIASMEELLVGAA